MATWVKKARNILELFSRCLKNCEDDTAEAQNALVDVLGMYMFRGFSTAN